MAARPEERPAASEVVQVLESMTRGLESVPEKLLFAWEMDDSRLGPGQRLHSRVEYERMLAQARIDEGQARVAAEAARGQARRAAVARRGAAPRRHVPAGPAPHGSGSGADERLGSEEIG